MVDKQVSELAPPELNKATHTMRDLAKEENAPVVQAVPYPTSEAGVGFLSVHAADGRVLFSGFNLEGFQTNPESPLNSVGVYHFVRLTGVGRIKCGSRHTFPTFYTAKILRKFTPKLFSYALLNNFLPSAKVPDPITWRHRFYHLHESSANSFKGCPTWQLFERNDVPQT